jgi:hypothetical protein
VVQDGVVQGRLAAGHAGRIELLGHWCGRCTGPARASECVSSLPLRLAFSEAHTGTTAQTELLRLVPVILEFVIADRFKFTSGKTERGDNRPFKTALYNYYLQPSPLAEAYPDKLLCALTGLELPSSAVIATHLWKREFKASAGMLFKFTDIDEPRNGLLLYKLFAEAYDRAQLCFIYHTDEATWRCHVLDKAIMSLTWKQYLKPSKDSPPEGTSGEAVLRVMETLNNTGFKTFQDVDGRPLHLPATQQPFKRVLNLHARLAQKRAIQNNALPEPDWDFENFHSDAMYASRSTLEGWAREVGSEEA